MVPPTKLPLRPETVSVLGKPITFKYVPPGDDLLKVNSEDLNPGVACSFPDRQLIALEEGQPLEQEQDAVIHELLHIIEDYMDIKASEKTVQKFATGWLSVIKANPKLVRYLMRKS